MPLSTFLQPIMNIAKNIKKFRSLAKISQEELAEKIGLTRNYLSLVESGKREPSIDTLSRISKELKVPTSVLVLDIKDSPKSSLDRLLLRAYEIASKNPKRD